MREMSFKDVFISSSCGHFYSVEQNQLYSYGKGHYEEHFCDFLFIWIRGSGENVLRDFLSGALPALLFDSRTICAILVEGIMNIYVKLSCIWISGRLKIFLI